MVGVEVPCKFFELFVSGIPLPESYGGCSRRSEGEGNSPGRAPRTENEAVFARGIILPLLFEPSDKPKAVRIRSAQPAVLPVDRVHGVAQGGRVVQFIQIVYDFLLQGHGYVEPFEAQSFQGGDDMADGGFSDLIGGVDGIHPQRPEIRIMHCRRQGFSDGGSQKSEKFGIRPEGFFFSHDRHAPFPRYRHQPRTEDVLPVHLLRRPQCRLVILFATVTAYAAGMAGVSGLENFFPSISSLGEDGMYPVFSARS